jgi:hypothetical protein
MASLYSWRAFHIESADWRSLHSRIVTFRDQYDMTINAFLQRCELDPHRSYFRQLCSRTGYHICPSRREGSAGHFFRHKSLEGLKRPPAFVPTEFLSQAKDNWLLDNRKILIERGIVNVGTNLTVPNLIQALVQDFSTVADSELLELLRQDASIKPLLTNTCSIFRIVSTPLSIMSPVLPRNGLEYSNF